MHLQVSDPEDWHAKHPGDMPSGKCFYCWEELQVGDNVVVRQLFSADTCANPGDKGAIEAIYSSEDGSIFSVKLANGKDYYFIRAELRKQREGDEK